MPLPRMNPHLLCSRNARALPLLLVALASVSFGFVLVRVRVRFRQSDLELHSALAETDIPKDQRPKYTSFSCFFNE